ncbi:MAG: polysaccharide biosynthesis C-terminal domain-containing protein, partial [Ruminococcus sp.]|nr:polysaccharide biosynthesis C-terminal domain-containing protein [Ruminococcus sp.]
SMLQAIGKASVPLKIMLAGTAIKFAGNYFLIPVMGVDGAALSTTICYSAILLLSLWSFTVYAGVKLEMLPFIKVIYSGAMCGGTAYLMSSLLRSGSLFIDLAVTACVGGAVYFAMICCVTDRAVKKKRACTDADS